MNRKTLTTMTLALLAAAAMTACGTSTEDAPEAADPAHSTADPAHSTAESAHSTADVTFARAMVPHHAQAVQMAALAADHASSAEVKTLAAAIGAEQRPEIDQLTSMLGRWREPVASGHATEHAGHGMAGMASDADLAALAKARGKDFDRRFLTLMIAHHEGAVKMAATELRDGRDPEALGLARKITDSQRAEIDRMRALLQN